MRFSKFRILLSLLFGCLSGCVLVFYFLIRELPTNVLEQLKLKVASNTKPTIVLDHSGQKLGLIAEEIRYDIPLSSIPIHVQKAFLAAEDAGFYKHHGVSLAGLARSAWVNLKNERLAQGGSTITQQLVRQHLLKREKSINRKVKEIYLALLLEHQATKPQILEMWLNSIFLGNNAWGIEAASRVYFKKPASKLNINEAALLAGLPQAPTKYAPHINPKAANLRRQYVLKQLEKNNWISASLLRQSYKKSPKVFGNRMKLESDLPWITESVRNELSRSLELRDTPRSGLKVWTHLDANFQNLIDAKFQKYLHPFVGRGLEAAFVAVDATTGKLLAIVGGLDFEKSQFNRSLLMRRPFGQSINPLLFGWALDKGILTLNGTRALGSVAITSAFQEVDPVAMAIGTHSIKERIKNYSLPLEDKFSLDEIRGSPWDLAQAWRTILGRPGTISNRIIDKIESPDAKFDINQHTRTAYQGVSKEASYSVFKWLQLAGFKGNYGEDVRFATSTGWDYWDIALKDNIIVVGWAGVEYKPISDPKMFFAFKKALSLTMNQWLNDTGHPNDQKIEATPARISWHLVKRREGDFLRVPFPVSIAR